MKRLIALEYYNKEIIKNKLKDLILSTEELKKQLHSKLQTTLQLEQINLGNLLQLCNLKFLPIIKKECVNNAINKLNRQQKDKEIKKLTIICSTILKNLATDNDIKKYVEKCLKNFSPKNFLNDEVKKVYEEIENILTDEEVFNDICLKVFDRIEPCAKSFIQILYNNTNALKKCQNNKSLIKQALIMKLQEEMEDYKIPLYTNEIKIYLRKNYSIEIAKQVFSTLQKDVYKYLDKLLEKSYNEEEIKTAIEEHAKVIEQAINNFNKQLSDIKVGEKFINKIEYWKNTSLRDKAFVIINDKYIEGEGTHNNLMLKMLQENPALTDLEQKENELYKENAVEITRYYGKSLGLMNDNELDKLEKESNKSKHYLHLAFGYIVENMAIIDRASLKNYTLNDVVNIIKPHYNIIFSANETAHNSLTRIC